MRAFLLRTPPGMKMPRRQVVPGAPASCCVNAALPDDGDGLERRSLTGTARLRRANKSLLHARMARHRLPRHVARERYVVAALRAACPVRDRRSKPADRQVRA